MSWRVTILSHHEWIKSAARSAKLLNRLRSSDAVVWRSLALVSMKCLSHIEHLDHLSLAHATREGKELDTCLPPYDGYGDHFFRDQRYLLCVGVEITSLVAVATIQGGMGWIPAAASELLGGDFLGERGGRSDVTGWPDGCRWFVITLLRSSGSVTAIVATYLGTQSHIVVLASKYYALHSYIFFAAYFANVNQQSHYL
jgi:hypothetical protein